jgi:hypothetical protein
MSRHMSGGATISKPDMGACSRSNGNKSVRASGSKGVFGREEGSVHVWRIAI